MSKYVTLDMLNSENAGVGNNFNSSGASQSFSQGGDKMLQNLDRVEKLLDKGMLLFDRFQQIRQKKAEQDSMSAIIERKADKMASQQAPQIIYKVPKITFKTEQLIQELEVGVEKLKEKYGDRTVKSLIDDELVQLKESGMVKPFIEGILNKLVEVQEE